VLELLRDSVDRLGQTIVMVTHDPRAAAFADRVLFLADGGVQRELRGGSQGEILRVLQEVSVR
jgi:putative ABC transport system ATP-binding protein